jgi:glutamate synthase domain-containing protein 1
MEGITMSYEVTGIMNQVTDINQITNTVNMIESTVKSVMDISADMSKVISMTPKDGYQKKVELISIAEEMSTKEKIAAIDAAEDKYVQNLSNNADMYKGMMWAKIGMALTCTAGIVLLGSSQEGRKIAKNLLKIAA